MEEVSHERLAEAQVSAILEAALQAAEAALTPDQCLKLFRRGELPVSSNETRRELIKRLLEALMETYAGRGVELQRVASGYRLQVRQEYSRWVSRLWEEKPPRYSRALLETMALIAYRQPVTRGDIEQVRGVAVSQNIMRTLSERGWIREVGHREVPGRPALYGTSKAFLDYFNLKSLAQLPPLEEIRELIEPVIIEELAGAAEPVNEPAPEAAAETELTEAAAETELIEAAAETELTEAAAGIAVAEAAAGPEVTQTEPEEPIEDLAAAAGIEVSLDAIEEPQAADDAKVDTGDPEVDPGPQSEPSQPPVHTADVVPLPRKR